MKQSFKVITIFFSSLGISCSNLNTNNIELNSNKFTISSVQNNSSVFKNIQIKKEITKVQPMTGLVLWDDSEFNNTDSIQLEFKYIGYNKIVKGKGIYDWSYLEKVLNSVKDRKHQSVIRFYDTYVGQKTTVPDYIKALSNYKEKTGLTEGKKTYFPDWSNKTYQDFILEFMKKFSTKYDNDPRIAYLQVGFGLWGEYHIYEGPMKLGVTFPSKDYQKNFFNQMSQNFINLKWSISIDSASPEYGPFEVYKTLLKNDFGLFDDSFLSEEHSQYNELNFNYLGKDRFLKNPIGGELNYYTDYDQIHALDTNGPHGVSFEQMSNKFHVSYMIGNDQPLYQPINRIKNAGMSLGYKFKITSLQTSSSQTLLTVKNTGIAPIYYNAYFSINNIKSTESLKYLAPNQEKTISINKSLKNTSDLKIVSDKLVSGQTIDFEANL
ncbi:MAG: DUF4832 domain-containing protein [Candidatus Sericytochromatia bacterium]